MTLRSRHADIMAEDRARRALQQSGFDGTGILERADSTRNEVFLSERHVVRVNQTLDRRLRREAAIYQMLPQEHWAPRLLATGGDSGRDYIVLHRHPGAPLSRWWPELGERQRRHCVEGLAAAMEAIHHSPVGGDFPPPHNPPHSIEPGKDRPLDILRSRLSELSELDNVDGLMLITVADALHGADSMLTPAAVPHGLVHGDLTLENVIASNDGLEAVIDFEWARFGPVDLDLDIIFRFACYPHLHVPPHVGTRYSPTDFWPAMDWLLARLPHITSIPHLRPRLELYALSFEVARVLEMPPTDTVHNLDHDHPYRRLVSLVDGVSRLHRLLDALQI